MLIKFEVDNFFSIRERQTLDLNVDLNAPDLPSRLPAPIARSKDRVTRVAVLFGPNASGKTNILKALSFLVKFVQGATWGENEIAPFFAFATLKHLAEPTRLYAEFDSELIPGQPHCVYSYEVIFQNSKSQTGVVTHVSYEALKYFPKGKPKRLVERKGNRYFAASEFKLRKSDQRLSFIGKTKSIISVLAQFNHELSATILQRLQTVQSNVLQDRAQFSAEAMTGYYEKNPAVLNEFKKRVRIMDLGIEDIQLVRQPSGIVPTFKHKGIETPIVLGYESEGTQSLYRIFPFLFYVLTVGGLAIIDELDRDIHPLLLPEIVGWFHNPELNKSNGQLIMSCHNATLLEYLIKEEVFLTEKTDDGGTRLFALQDVRGVRRDTNIYAKYLSGIFSAVPRIG